MRTKQLNRIYWLALIVMALVVSSCSSTPSGTAPGGGAPPANETASGDQTAANPAGAAENDQTSGAAGSDGPDQSPTEASPLPDPVQIELLEQGFSAPATMIGYGFLVHNPNPSHAVINSVFNVTFTDASGGTIGTDKGSIAVLLPGQTLGIGSTCWFDTGVNIQSMDVQLTSGEAVVLTEKLPEYEVKNASLGRLLGYTLARAEIASPYPANDNSPRISVVYYDANGKIIGGGSGYRAGLIGNSLNGVVISGIGSEGIDKFEVYAGLSAIPVMLPPELPVDFQLLLLKGSSFTQNEGFLTYNLVVENPNANYLVDRALYQVKAYNSDGALILAHQDLIFSLLPGQMLGISAKYALCEGDVVDHIEVEVSYGQYEPSTQTAYFSFEDAALQAGEGSAAISGTVRNLTNQDIKTINVTAIVYDNSGQIIGGGAQLVDLLPANGSLPVEFQALINGEA